MFSRLILAAVFFTVGVILGSCTDASEPSEVFAKESRSAGSVPRYDIFELSFEHNGIYENKFFDVTLDTVFTSPSGVERRIKGFFYGGDLWKVRFRPDEPGRWTYAYVMVGKGGFRKEGSGTFDCTPSDAEGPVRRHPKNPYRWVFANREPYFPIGMQDCMTLRGTKFRQRLIDGEGRGENKGRSVSLEEYLSVYGQSGFNLLRFSQRNCSYSLFGDLDHYNEAESIATDELLSLARKHGFRVMFGFFGSYGNWSSLGTRSLRVLSRNIKNVLGLSEEAVSAPDDYDAVAKEKRFIDYCIARWGVYVDFWELLNERKASDEWVSEIADYVRSIDPDRKPISTSWEKPHLPAIDINAPHWYQAESELESDLRVKQKADEWKQTGKSVIVGEHGNKGMNWDPLSGLRMRIRTWTALFQEISLIFWNTSWSKRGVFHGRYTPGEWANIYLGPEERKYICVLEDFSSRLDADVRMVSVEVSFPNQIRTYGLLSDTVAAAYFHHFKNHATPVRGAKVTLDLPRAAHSTSELVGEWIDPATGNVISRVKITPGRHTFEVPPFTVDLALLVTPKRNGSYPLSLCTGDHLIQ